MAVRMVASKWRARSRAAADHWPRFSRMNRSQAVARAARRPVSRRLAVSQADELWKARTIRSSSPAAGRAARTGAAGRGGSKAGALLMAYRLRTSSTWRTSAGQWWLATVCAWRAVRTAWKRAAEAGVAVRASTTTWNPT